MKKNYLNIDFKLILIAIKAIKINFWYDISFSKILENKI